MARYELIKDFLNVPQGQDIGYTPDQLSLSAYWVILVLPFNEEVTFYRNSMKSYDTDPSQAVKIGYPLVITSDCTLLQVGQSKGSFQSNLQARLVAGGTNYLTRVFPGDWMFAWMFQNRDDAQSVISRISLFDPDHPCNGFMDGLKFVGRVTSCRKVLTQTPGGQRTAAYNLQGHGFAELESEVFYEPDLPNSFQQTMGTNFAALDQNINNFISAGGVVESSSAIPFLITLFLGKGLPPAVSVPAQPNAAGNPPQIAYGATGNDPGVVEEEAPYAYLIPQEVGALLGKSSSSKTSGILSAADIDEVWIGIQKYTGGIQGGAVAQVAPQAMFTPDGLGPGKNGGVNAGHQFTKYPLLGTFVPDFPQLTGNKTVWTIVNQFLNPAVNEMYACLRSNQNGQVVPMIVARQIPFTSDAFASSLGSVPGSSTAPGTVIKNQYLQAAAAAANSVPTVTRFLEMPRWHIHPLMFISSDIGRSDTKRFNFVHVYGEPTILMDNNTIQAQIAKNPPVQDLADAKRSGLRLHMGTVSCSPEDIVKNGSGYGPALWMAMISDWSMGMHLTLDGTMNVHGIQAPIPPGDNIEFDGVVYHIESVTHTCQLSPDGKQRSFITTLTLTNGIHSDDPSLPDPIVHATQTPDQSIYAGIIDTDQTTYDPGFTYDANTSQQQKPPIIGAEATPTPADIDEVS
jgi:hypothetical protein